MQDSVVRLCVPAEARYARSVRMMASSLAVVSGMGIDDVEDVRMVAEEGFVYSCATKPAACDMTFALGDGSVSIDFSLGDVHDEQIEAAGVDLSLVELLSAICDDFTVTDDNTLHVVKRMMESDGVNA